jgi:hypothetical protein
MLTRPTPVPRLEMMALSQTQEAVEVFTAVHHMSKSSVSLGLLGKLDL